MEDFVQWFSKCGRQTIASSPGNLLEMQILRPYPLPTESVTPGWDPAPCVFNKLSR